MTQTPPGRFLVLGAAFLIGGLVGAGGLTILRDRANRPQREPVRPSRSEQDATAPTAARQPVRHGNVKGLVPEKSASSINSILDLWSTGQEDQAVAALLQLAETTKDHPSPFRPYELSEEGAPSVSPDQRLSEEMFERYDLLGKLGRGLVDRAWQSLARGNRDDARALLLALKRLGTANTGPEVPSTAHNLGQVLQVRADRRLSQLHKHGPE